ncbi:pentatricopeptide repeat-containing protein [Striga asiatica]|uniref:Pentatricopeptide repeat-containing protein n=1 Tax=Striga asiatica TaxID=4170 RepID=A0A5A7QAG0_STRAF|nr:pentatricopeptide repeat-containing protein [Striga asiatica]
MEDLMGLLRGHVPRAHLLQIHARLLQLGAHRDNLVATRLIGHYPPSSALRVFYSLQNPNIFPFNAVIRVLADEGLASKAFSIFKELKNRPLSPNGLTFSFLLKACSSNQGFTLGTQHVR